MVLPLPFLALFIALLLVVVVLPPSIVLLLLVVVVVVLPPPSLALFIILVNSIVQVVGPMSRPQAQVAIPGRGAQEGQGRVPRDITDRLIVTCK